MRIVIIPSWYPSDEDPTAGVFVEDQAIALSSRHDVVVLTMDHWGVRALRRRGFPAGRPRFENRHGVTVARTSFLEPSSRVFGRDARWPAYLAHVDTTLRAIEKRFGPVDILHPHVVFPAGWAAVNVGRQRGIPVVLTEHSGPFRVHFDQGPFWAAATRSTLREADEIVAVSEGLRRQILEVSGRDPIVAGNVFDTDMFSPAVGPRAPGPVRFATVAILGHHKGVDVLLHACRELLAADMPGWSLTVGGDGPERPALERLTDELGLRDRVRFLGVLDRIGVRDLLRASDAFVLASRHDNLPGVIAEAMLVGLPVIATRSGGPEYMVPSDLGVIIPVEDAPALAAAMGDLIARRFVVSSAASRAHAMKQWGREAFLDRLDAIYLRMLRTRSAPGIG